MSAAFAVEDMWSLTIPTIPRTENLFLHEGLDPSSEIMNVLRSPCVGIRDLILENVEIPMENRI